MLLQASCFAGRIVPTQALPGSGSARFTLLVPPPMPKPAHQRTAQPPRRFPDYRDPDSWRRRCHCLGIACWCCLPRRPAEQGRGERLSTRLGNLFAMVGGGGWGQCRGGAGVGEGWWGWCVWVVGVGVGNSALGPGCWPGVSRPWASPTHNHHHGYSYPPSTTSPFTHTCARMHLCRCLATWTSPPPTCSTRLRWR